MRWALYIWIGAGVIIAGCGVGTNINNVRHRHSAPTVLFTISTINSGYASSLVCLSASHPTFYETGTTRHGTHELFEWHAELRSVLHPYLYRVLLNILLFIMKSTQIFAQPRGNLLRSWKPETSCAKSWSRSFLRTDSAVMTQYKTMSLCILYYWQENRI